MLGIGARGLGFISGGACFVLAIAGCADPTNSAGSGSSGSSTSSDFTFSNADITAFALKTAAADNDPQPQSIEWVLTNRDAAERLSNDGNPVNKGVASTTVYLVQMEGSFKHSSATPPGDFKQPTGTFVTLVVDARTGELYDYGLSGKSIELGVLGRVVTALP